MPDEFLPPDLAEETEDPTTDDTSTDPSGGSDPSGGTSGTDEAIGDAPSDDDDSSGVVVEDDAGSDPSGDPIDTGDRDPSGGSDPSGGTSGTDQVIAPDTTETTDTSDSGPELDSEPDTESEVDESTQPDDTDAGDTVEDDVAPRVVDARRGGVERSVQRDPSTAGFDPGSDISRLAPGAFAATVETDAGDVEERLFAFDERAQAFLRRRERRRARRRLVSDLEDELGQDLSEGDIEFTETDGSLSASLSDEFVDELRADAEQDARQRLERDLESELGQDVDPGEDFVVTETDEGLRAELTPEFRRELAEVQLEGRLESDFERDLEAGRDFVVVEEDGEFRGRLTEEFERELAEQRLERDLEKELGEDVEAGRDFTIRRSDDGFEADFTESFRRERATEEVETKLEEQFGTDLQAGRDFRLEPTEDDDFSASLTKEGQLRVRGEGEEEFGDIPVRLPERVAGQEVPFGGERVETVLARGSEAFSEGVEEAIGEDGLFGESIIAEGLEAAEEVQTDPTLSRGQTIAGVSTRPGRGASGDALLPGGSEIAADVEEGGRSVLRGAGVILNVPETALGLKEAGEFVVEGASQTASGDLGLTPEVEVREVAGGRPQPVITGVEVEEDGFAQRSGEAAGAAVRGFVETAEQRPVETGALVGGSLLASGALISGASRASTRAGRATAAAIQPGEELLTAGANIAAPARVQRVFPGGRIDNEEIVIREAARAGRLTRAGAARATRRIAAVEAERVRPSRFVTTRAVEGSMMGRARGAVAGAELSTRAAAQRMVEVEFDDVTRPVRTRFAAAAERARVEARSLGPTVEANVFAARESIRRAVGGSPSQGVREAGVRGELEAGDIDSIEAEDVDVPGRGDGEGDAEGGGVGGGAIRMDIETIGPGGQVSVRRARAELRGERGPLAVESEFEQEAERDSAVGRVEAVTEPAVQSGDVAGESPGVEAGVEGLGETEFPGLEDRFSGVEIDQPVDQRVDVGLDFETEPTVDQRIDMEVEPEVITEVGTEIEQELEVELELELESEVESEPLFPRRRFNRDGPIGRDIDLFTKKFSENVATGSEVLSGIKTDVDEDLNG